MTLEQLIALIQLRKLPMDSEVHVEVGGVGGVGDDVPLANAYAYRKDGKNIVVLRARGTK